jgi:membrane protein implicated in regulation of membrane protease activity
MTKTWTFKGFAYLFSGIIGLLVGLYALITTTWILGAFLSVLSLIFIVIALRSRETVEKEKEKPLMDVTT